MTARSCIRFLVHSAVSATRFVAEWTLLSLSRRRTHDNWDVFLLGEAAEDEVSMECVRKAVSLIERLDPSLSMQVRMATRHILVWNGSRIEYWGVTRTCVLSRDKLKRYSDALTAAYIVHEGTHLRLHARGVRYWPQLRDRIERYCNREMIRFLMKLPRAEFPSTDALIAHLETLTIAD